MCKSDTRKGAQSEASIQRCHRRHGLMLLIFLGSGGGGTVERVSMSHVSPFPESLILYGRGITHLSSGVAKTERNNTS